MALLRRCIEELRAAQQPGTARPSPFAAPEPARRVELPPRQTGANGLAGLRRPTAATLPRSR